MTAPMPAAEVLTLPMRPLPRTLVTIATYNEIENLPPLLASIWDVIPQLDVLVIDDNSPDGTGTWAEEKARSEPRLKVLRRAGKLGLGTAIMAGLAHAQACDYEWAVNMDADFSHHPRYLPTMLANTDQADVIIGSRYVPGGGVRDWPLHRRLMSRAVNIYARTFLGLPVRDCSGAFRAYRTATLRHIDFSRIRSRGYAFQEEILWALKGAGARFFETPILFTDREYGRSKINRQEAIDALSIIWVQGAAN